MDEFHGLFDRLEETVGRPPDPAVLWRYLPVAQFVRLLQSSSLWFSRVDLLGDPFEGSLTRINISHREDLIQGVAMDAGSRSARTMRKAFGTSDGARKAVFVSCWHQADSESDAMWRLYMSDAGVAVRTTVGRLRRQLSNARTPGASRPLVGSVQYIDYDADIIPDWHWMIPAFFKRRAFSHEKEVRAAFLYLDWALADDGESRDFSRDAPNGFNVPVEPNELIEAVRVNPCEQSWLLETIRELSVAHGLNAPIQQSELSRPPRW